MPKGPKGQKRPADANQLAKAIVDLAGRGKITLIKAYRECTGCGLKEAKDEVETLPYSEWREMQYTGNIANVLRLFDLDKPAPDSPFVVAMRNIERNWRELGFPTLGEGVRVVSANF